MSRFIIPLADVHRACLPVSMCTECTAGMGVLVDLSTVEQPGDEPEWTVIPLHDQSCSKFPVPQREVSMGEAAELWLSLDPMDKTLVRAMAGGSFGGEVTLPSGRTLSSRQMQAIRPAITNPQK